jgi:hypothetical protein
LSGRWIPVRDQGMDCGIAVDLQDGTARCLRFHQAGVGDAIVVGHTGVRVFPEQRSRGGESFGFMGSAVSTEKPKGTAIRQIARELVQHQVSGGKILMVVGPAVIHTGSGEFLCELIRRGFVQRLFAGNALATHDIEQALFGTSLGVYLDQGNPAETGHAHHLRAINRIRRAGGIRAAVEQGILTSGLLYECLRHDVDVLLAGSIRDDGPLPEVITDALQAQMLMREKVRDVTFCLIPLELVDGRYYHLDTCFCPLAADMAIYYPPAFDDYGRKVLRGLIGELIPVGDAEAARFACNAVVLDRIVVTNTGCPRLHRDLTARGFTCLATPLSEFIKAGGSAKCLTLRLDGEDAAAWK